MMRHALIACLPWLGWLLAACVCLAAIVRLHRARFHMGRLRWRRLRQLHGNQAGSAQTLFFVWTLPFFVMIVLFIVQVSQLMIGLIVVQYAAYAAARSAAVWIPARVDDGPELENCLSFYVPDPDAPEQFFPILDSSDEAYGPSVGGVTYRVMSGTAKFEKIRSAAVMACAPISPSRATEAALSVGGSYMADALDATFDQMAPNTQSGRAAIRRRMRNKVAYAWENTFVEIRFFHPNSEPPLVWYDKAPDPDEFREPRELGWQDPVTVTVHYNMALLPGVGRFLAKPEYSPDGKPDKVAASIVRQGNQRVIPLTASATMGIEGEKSVVPYAYSVY
jgi:hypothetical protein